MNLVRKALLKHALGPTFDSMLSTIERNPGLRSAHMVDIHMRSNGKDVRMQADWLMEIARIVLPPLNLPPVEEEPPPREPKRVITEEVGWGAVPHVDGDPGTGLYYVDTDHSVKYTTFGPKGKFTPAQLVCHVDDATLDRLKAKLETTPGDTIRHVKALNGFLLCSVNTPDES